jgi:hypothetical protein
MKLRQDYYIHTDNNSYIMSYDWNNYKKTTKI